VGWLWGGVWWVGWVRGMGRGERAGNGGKGGCLPLCSYALLVLAGGRSECAWGCCSSAADASGWTPCWLAGWLLQIWQTAEHIWSD
jgi:hypothetical protein